MRLEGHEPLGVDQSPSRWLIPVLTLTSTINILSARALPVFLPLVATDLGTSVAVLNQVPSAMPLFAELLALVEGPLADHYGDRATLMIGLLTIVVSTVATGLAPTFPVLLLVTLVGALARAVIMPTTQAVVVTGFGDGSTRRRAVSWVTAGMSGAPIIGIPVLITTAGISSRRASFFVLGAMAFATTLVL